MLKSLENLYDVHGQSLFGFVWNWTRSDAETLDVIQEVFSQLAKKDLCLDEIQHPRAFLFLVARRCLLDRERQQRRRRRRERQSSVDSRQFALAEDPDRAVLRESLEAALASLPSMQRSVVYLKLWEEFTFQQIAECLEILPNTAASRYRLGLVKLRETLKPLYDEIQP